MANSSDRFRQILELSFGLKIPGATKLLVWSIGLITVIGLTIYGFVPLISEYRNNNVATQVHIVLLDNHFRPPQMVFGLPQGHYRNKFGDDLIILAASLYENGGSCGSEAFDICEKLRNSSWDVWSDTVQNFNRTTFKTFYSDLTLAFIEKIFTASNPEEIFAEQNFHWNDALAASFMNYAFWRIWVDYHLNPSPPDHIRLSNLYPPPDFGQKIENFETKFEDLYSHILTFLCTRIKYTELDYLDDFNPPTPNEKRCSDLLLNSETPVYIGTALFFTLPASSIPKIKEYRFSVAQKSRSLGNFSDPYTAMSLFADSASLYTCVLDQVYAPKIFQAHSDNQNGQRVIIKYKVQIRAKETRSKKFDCLNGTSATTCFAQCTKMWIIEKCKCVPFIVKKGLKYPNLEAIPNCNLINYATCNITSLPQNINDQCLEKCKRPCDYTIYFWQISYESIEPLENDVSEFVIKMIPLFDTFVELTWTEKDTPEQFFSQLAGVGSFYLGFSGLSAISIILWCLDSWKKFRKGNARRSMDFKGKRSGKGRFCVPCDDHCGKPCEEWLLNLKAGLQIEWREDIEAIMEKKYGIRKRGISV